MKYIVSFSYGFAHIGRVGSVFITLSVTIERFFAITYPLKKLNLKRWLILSSVSGAVLYNLPRFFELRYMILTYRVVQKNSCMFEFSRPPSAH